MTTRHPELQMNDMDAEREDEIKREAEALVRDHPEWGRARLQEETYFWINAAESEARLVDSIAGGVWDGAHPVEVAP